MISLIAVTFTLGCSPFRPAAPGGPLDQKAEQAQLEALKAQARAAASPTGCKQATGCKALPIGSRPCGGPSDYLVYCATTTDLPRLTQKAKLVTDAEAAFNRKHSLMSICSVLPPPTVTLENGACVVQAPKATDLPM